MKSQRDKDLQTAVLSFLVVGQLTTRDLLANGHDDEPHRKATYELLMTLDDKTRDAILTAGETELATNINQNCLKTANTIRSSNPDIEIEQLCIEVLAIMEQIYDLQFGFLDEIDTTVAH